MATPVESWVSWLTIVGMIAAAAAAGCRDGAVPAMCGDGVVDVGEACDDGNLVYVDDCLPGCQLAACGDYILRTSPTRPDDREACDSGGVDTPGCDADCSALACGDGHLNRAAGEVCDDGDIDGADGCSPDCRSDETCGNGIVDDHLPRRGPADRECLSATFPVGGCAEVCDDGNRVSGDGCSASCLSDESCPNGIVDEVGIFGERCDDGNHDNCDACPSHCQADGFGTSCGDGIVSPCGDEECDGAGQETALCDYRIPDFAGQNCTVALCGDLHVNAAAGEQCDDGNAVLTDNCVHCRGSVCGDGAVDLQPPGVEACDLGPLNGTPGAGCSATCTAVSP